MTYNTEGIILKYRDIGEFDRIYSILTRDHGKVEAWAQGVRKPVSKLVAHLQLLYRCDFMFARGRRFDRIAQVRMFNRWPEILGDLEKMGQAIYAVSLIDTVLRPGTKERGVFELLLGYLEIQSLNTQRLDLGILTMFSLKLLKESGFSPELHYCVLCKARVDGLSRKFDAIRGGVLCEDCFRKAGSEAFPVSSLTLETLEEIFAVALTPLEMPDVIQRELETVAHAMIAAHFGEEPKSRAFLDFLSKQSLALEAGV